MNKVIEIKQPAKTNIIIDGDVITLERKGLLNSINVGLNANKTFKIKNINSVQIKKPGLTNGYIQFGILGDGGSRQGVKNATTDENSVMFTKKHYKDMLELKAYIDNFEEVTMSHNNQSNGSVADELIKLKGLLNDGILTDDEFQNMKSKLLS